MRLNLRGTHDYWLRKQSERELQRWGRFHGKVFSSAPHCTLAELSLYGIRVGAVHYGQVSSYYPDILQTQRVWAFMPDPAQRITYLHYCYGGTSKARKALLLGLSRDKFNYHLAKGLEFYMQHRDFDFASVWGSAFFDAD